MVSSAGPATTTSRAGNTHRIIGTSIFTGSFWARSCCGMAVAQASIIAMAHWTIAGSHCVLMGWNQPTPRPAAPHDLTVGVGGHRRSGVPADFGVVRDDLEERLAHGVKQAGLGLPVVQTLGSSLRLVTVSVSFYNCLASKAEPGKRVRHA